MSRVLVVGATGLIGSAVAEVMAADHEVITASRSRGEQVDLADRSSVQALFGRIGEVDHVVSCTGSVPFKPMSELTVDDYAAGLTDKVLGQIGLVVTGTEHVRDGGSFTLISGVLARAVIATGAAASTANGALESFVRAAAVGLPRGLRINAVSPGVIAEAESYHASFPGFPLTPRAEVARVVRRSVDGVETGQVFEV